MSDEEDEASMPTQREKEMKVKIPVELHVKLHTLKVLKGQQISSTVEAALDRYFDLLAEKPAGKQLDRLSEQTVGSLG